MDAYDIIRNHCVSEQARERREVAALRAEVQSLVARQRVDPSVQDWHIEVASRQLRDHQAVERYLSQQVAAYPERQTAGVTP
jgi:hypothetical protein